MRKSPLRAGESKLWYLVSYDIREPSRYRKAHKVIKGYGESVQYSVFRVRCTARELERLRFELAKVIEDEDRLLVVRLCPGCASRVTMRGREPVPLEPDPPPFKIF